MALLDDNEDLEVLQIIDLVDMEKEHLDVALEKIDSTRFDVFHFETILSENSL
jgi:hypothetical protein